MLRQFYDKLLYKVRNKIIMADSLSDILKKRNGSSKEPDDFLIIRKFVQDKYSITPKLSINKNSIIVGVPNSAIAGNLRFDLFDLGQKLSSIKRLVIRIDCR